MIRLLRRPPSRRGLSLTETLVSLAATAGLLTAAAASFHASSSAAEINENTFRASQSARLTMSHVLHTVRRCTAAQASEDGRRLDLIMPDEPDVAYVFDPQTHELRVIVDEQEGQNSQSVLARNVQSMDFVVKLSPDPDTGVLRAVQVSVDMVVQTHSATARLSGSAALRRVRMYH